MRSAHIRILAGALAALWLALPVATAIHGAAEEHEYCVEHQAFEHGADTPALAEVALEVPSAAPVADADDHAACAFDEALLRDAPQPDANSGVRAVAVGTHALAGPAAAPAHVRDVLASAPKTSPPLLLTV